MEQLWTVRKYREGDEKGVLKLTEAIYGEVQDKEQWMKWWNWRFGGGPCGVPIIWLAECNGELVGQYLITRVKMKVGDEVITGSQRGGTMTHPDYRRLGIFEALGKKTHQEAGEKGIPLVYAFPNKYSYQGSVKKLNWFDVCPRQIMIKPLNLENILRKHIPSKLVAKILAGVGNLTLNLLYRTRKPPEVDGLTITRVSSFDERINDLWKKISNEYEIAIVRDKEYLNWRYVDIPNIDYAIYLAEKEGQILGYTVLRCKKQQGLIIGRIFELIVPLEQQAVAQSLLAKAIEFFKEEGADLALTYIIGNKIYGKTLRRSGFIFAPFINRELRFIVRMNTPETPETFLRNPERWFIQLGDSDLV